MKERTMQPRTASQVALAVGLAASAWATAPALAEKSDQLPVTEELCRLGGGVVETAPHGKWCKGGDFKGITVYAKGKESAGSDARGSPAPAGGQRNPAGGGPRTGP
jgi:hypothetical protein